MPMNPSIKKQHYNLGKLPKYTLYSLIATVLDFSIAWTLTILVQGNLVVANTIGSLCGFFLHYILASRSVFKTEYGAIGFVIYLSTFLFGLIIGNIIIYYTFHGLRTFLHYNLAFIAGKLLALFVPFFIVYFLRSFIFNKLKNNDDDID